MTCLRQTTAWQASRRDKTTRQETKMLTEDNAGKEVTFLNRDHIISVTIRNSEIVVTTTVGSKITIPVSPAMIAKFADELANDVQSNFVSIASTPVSLS